MSKYIKSAFDAILDGLSLLAWWRYADVDDIPEPSSIDRYFARVGGYLIGARNRFEREYMGGIDVCG